MKISRQTGLPPVLAALLWSRGLRDDVHHQLNPPLRPAPIAALTQAAARLVDAVQTGRRVLIHGDYDADGISGTAVLYLGLRALGGKVQAFIPHRLKEGYGISMERVPDHIAAADLFITVDCGVTNLPEVAALQAAGVEVIITDHHTPGQQLPDCLVVHPRHADDHLTQQGELTGAGVAWHLLWAVHRQLGLPDPLEYTDLATLGTIADVAPLLGDNRALTQEGLKRMGASNWPGVRASVQHSRLYGDITARHVAFVLAPRLNAAGRLGEAELGLELLTTASESRAKELAIYLDARNVERKRIQDEMFERMLLQADPGHPALVVHDPDGHPGVMGIVASHLLERFSRPVFIIAQGKGSVRSTPGISAVGALTHASEHLLRFGGHSQAAGFAIRPDSVMAFTEKIHEYAAGFPTPVPQVVLDHILAPREASLDLLKEIGRLEPLGQGLQPPVFGLAAKVEQVRAVGSDGNTLQLSLAGMRGVGFRLGRLAPQLPPGTAIDAAISLTRNEFRGKTNLEFMVERVRHSSLLPLDAAGDAPPLQVRRGPPDGSGKHVTELPLGSTLESLAQPFRELLATGERVFLDLTAEAVAELERIRRQLPGISTARQAFVQIRHGRPLPWSEERNMLVLQILRELDLLDSRGFARVGQKRSPLDSDSLLRSETERYRLAAFLGAWQHLDDAALCMAVWRLFGPES